MYLECMQDFVHHLHLPKMPYAELKGGVWALLLR